MCPWFDNVVNGLIVTLAGRGQPRAEHSNTAERALLVKVWMRASKPPIRTFQVSGEPPAAASKPAAPLPARPELLV